MKGDRALVHRNGWLAVGFGFVALVVYLSLTPSPIDAGRLGEVKVGHFIAYAWLMLWFSQFHRSAAARLGFALAFCALGVGLEYAQGATRYRTFAFSDMRDNALGVLAGWVLGSTALGNALAAIEARFLAPAAERRP